MLKKPSKRPKKPEYRDVVADEPTKTMERFDDGLRRVLSVPKHTPKKAAPR